MKELKHLWQQYEQRAAVQAKAATANVALEHYRWMLEELRVSLFAQELKTIAPVSVKRLQKLWDEMGR